VNGKLKLRLSYANVVASLALFAALGGSSYAAISITGEQVRDSSLSGRDLRDGSLRSRDVHDHSLRALDFKASELPAGPRGAQGPTGAQGPRGLTGARGAAGPAGTARAYARVNHTCSGGPPAVCDLQSAKGISKATRPSTGLYCVTAPGLDPAQLPAAATVDWSQTSDPEGNYSVQFQGGAGGCPAGEFAFRTEFISPASATAGPTDNSGFTVVIP
jgi:hypothetical protein